MARGAGRSARPWQASFDQDVDGTALGGLALGEQERARLTAGEIGDEARLEPGGPRRQRRAGVAQDLRLLAASLRARATGGQDAGDDGDGRAAAYR